MMTSRTQPSVECSLTRSRGSKLKLHHWLNGEIVRLPLRPRSLAWKRDTKNPLLEKLFLECLRSWQASRWATPPALGPISRLPPSHLSLAGCCSLEVLWQGMFSDETHILGHRRPW